MTALAFLAQASLTACPQPAEADISQSAVDSRFDLGCVKTLRGMTAPRILRLVVTFRAKKCRNLSSAQHYDQIRFRFYTAWTQSSGKPGGNPALQQALT